MSKWRFQRGEIPMGCILGMIFAFLVVLIGIKMAPVMLRMGDLEREVRILADRGNRIEYTDKRILKEIVGKAKDLQLPVSEESVKISRSDSRMVVEVNYEYPFEFPGYTYIKQVRIYEDRPIF